MIRLWFFVVAAFLLWPSVAARAACSQENLLKGRTPITVRGVDTPERLTDGWLTVEGQPAVGPDSSQMRGLRPQITWDLGEPTRIVAAAVQADNNDTYRISVSTDGEHFEPLWNVSRVDGTGLRERLAQDLDGVARYVRFEAIAGDGVLASAEVRLYCTAPTPWPPLRVVRRALVVDETTVRLGQIQSIKVLLGAFSVPILLLAVPRLRGRVRSGAYLSIIALSLACWFNFGLFHGKTLVHVWDSFHYYMGTKYFPEVGYFDLYRCAAKAEREVGHEAVIDATPIRDVDDNRVYPGTWTRTHDGRCRGDFSPARWQSFTRDLQTFRSLFTDRPMVNSFTDHGFNAAPLHVAWLRLWTEHVPAGLSNIEWLVRLDWVAILATVGVIYWGFGPLGAALTAAMIGVGFLWNYHWVGGGIGRFTWLFCAAAGIAFLRRGRPFWGMVGLTTAGLLRLFPMLFVGATGIWILVRWARSGSLHVESRRALAGVAATIALGLALGAVPRGVGVYPEFARVVERHAATPLANHAGLSFILGLRTGQLPEQMMDPRLTDPYETWKLQHLANRRQLRPIWISAVVLSLAFIAWGARKEVPLSASPGLAGPLIFVALPLTSYDYVWLILLLPLVIARERRIAWFMSFCVLTQLAGIFEPDLQVRHVYHSLLCLVLMAAFARDVLRHPTPDAEEPLAA